MTIETIFLRPNQVNPDVWARVENLGQGHVAMASPRFPRIPAL